MKKLNITKQLILNCFLGLVAVCCILPMILVVCVSLTPENELAANGYRFIPSHFTLSSYRYLFRTNSAIIRSFGVSVLVTVCGTVINLLMTSMIAYAMSRKDVKYRNKVAFFLYFTMLFSGGLVATYLLYVKYLYLKNTFWVLVLPMLGNPWNTLIMRNFFASVPYSLIESAKLDGAGEFKTFWRIVVPISKPAFATIGLFVMFAYWNDWFLSLMYIENGTWRPLQYVLQSILMNIQTIMGNEFLREKVSGDIPLEGVRMALCVLAVVPIVAVYPFIQKYVVKGITIGAVKG